MRHADDPRPGPVGPTAAPPPRHGHNHSGGHPGSVIRIPRIYHAFTAAAFLGRRERLYAKLAEISGAEPGQDALDLGCGTGVLTRAVAERVGPTGSVLGIDPAEEMVRYAGQISPAHCRYTVMSAEALDLADGSVDLVVSALAVHHIAQESRLTAAAEAYRVLRPGGRIMLTDITLPSFGRATRLIEKLTRHDFGHDPAAEMPGLLSAAGFESVSTRRIPPVLVTVTARRPQTVQ